MAKLNTQVGILKASVMIFLAVGIASAGLISSVQSASAASSANLWAVPVNSRIDDGNHQILRLKFNLDTGNPLDKIRITLDQGTPEEKVLEFNGNGDIIAGDAAFVYVDGSIKFKTDGYLLSKLSGKFKIAIDKTELTVGDHNALAEIIITSAPETVTDDAQFKLRAGETEGQADLVVDSFFAWNNIKVDKKNNNAFIVDANEGTANAVKHTVKVYLSSDNVLDGSDVLVGEKETNNLKSDKDRLVKVQYEIPEGTDLGPAYLIAMVDADDSVSETDEDNNISSRAINVVA